MMRKASYRLGVTVSREMRVALEVLAGKSGLALTTQAMVVLRQALDKVIQSGPVQTRLGQDRAFASRDDWLMDRQTETYVSNALAAAEGTATDAPQP